MYRILLVEDDIDLSKEIALAFEKWGFKVELIDDFEVVLDEFIDKKTRCSTFRCKFTII